MAEAALFLLEEVRLFRAGWPPPFCAGELQHGRCGTGDVSEFEIGAGLRYLDLVFFPLFPFAELEGHLIN